MDKPEKKPRQSRRKKPTKKAAKKAVKKSVDDKDIYDSAAFPSLSSLASVLRACEGPMATNRKHSINAIGDHLQEHLGCFLLVGYTINGDPLNITYAPTPRDMDSLNTGLHRYIMNTGGL